MSDVNKLQCMALPVSKLDQEQIIKSAYDEANHRLRVDATVSASIGDVSIVDANTGDPMTVNPDGSTNVNIVNPIQIEVSAADGDNVAISDGTNTMTVNSDGSINTRVSNALVTAPYDYVGLINSVISGQTVPTTVVYKFGGASGTLVATLTLTYDGSANLTSVTKV